MRAESEPLDERLIGSSHLMQVLRATIATVANSAETVLITGESGTGKELVARAIHMNSSRFREPFVALNCGALTESLTESQLFGFVKGSFTGATTSQKGYFEAAGHGTIFLDELGELPLPTQARLLRVLQENTVRPIGLTGPREIPLHMRVITATNRNLTQEVAVGRFRQDLYYRLNVLLVHAPALRDHPEDVLPLAQHFITKYNENNQCQLSKHLAAEVLETLQRYSWPGNVRELENIIKRLALAADEAGSITAGHLQRIVELTKTASPTIVDNGSLTVQHGFLGSSQCLGDRGEREWLCRCSHELSRYRQCLQAAGGNISKAAGQLGIDRNTLSKRLRKLENQCANRG